jgi:hypothetical protein
MKDKRLYLRMSEKEMERINLFSQLSGLTKTEFVRRLIANTEPKIIENLHPNGVKEIINYLSKIGNLQKKIDNDLILIYREFYKDLDMSVDEVKRNYNELIRTRTELVESIKDIKLALKEILKEIQ